MGRPGAPGAPTFKQVIIDKGKTTAEGSRIPGSSATQDHAGHTETRSDRFTAGTGKGSTSKEGTSLDRPSQEADSQRNATDLNDNADQNTHLGRSGNSEGHRTQPKLQGRCKPKALDSVRVNITDPDLQEYRDHMSIYAIICKFMGFWPSEKALYQWIKQVWKPHEGMYNFT